jgi:hypothetical protein
MIQRVLRHTNTRTQWRYRHGEVANLREKVGGICFGPALGAEDMPPGDPAEAIAAGLAEVAAFASDEGRARAMAEIAAAVASVAARLRAAGAEESL